MESLELVKEIAKVLDKKKAVDIKAIRTEEVTIVSDYFVIASG
ncbi:MAG: RsfS/YbeB/iojap family protein, partial [Clostridia bacterium]|nr:RsfS/YbeB/iojap family protein [Clostridia bacterium]